MIKTVGGRKNVLTAKEQVRLTTILVLVAITNALLVTGKVFRNKFQITKKMRCGIVGKFKVNLCWWNVIVCNYFNILRFFHINIII